jgi:cell division protein FtsQ
MSFKVRILLLTVLAFAALVYLFAWSSAFSVKSVQVSGLPDGVSMTSFITKTHIQVGEKLARIEPRAVENNIEELSWVKSVSIDRNWFNGKVRVAIQSRVPVGVFRGRVLDSSGTLFDLPGTVPSGLPVVIAATPELGLDAISIFTALPSDIRESLISINARNRSSIASRQNILGRPLTVIWGAPEQIALKVSVYRALLALPENKKISKIDVSAPHAPIVK